MTFEEWQWLSLRMLIVFLMTLLGVGAVLFVTSLVGWFKRRQQADPPTEPDAASATWKRGREADVARPDTSRASPAQSTPVASTGEGVPSDRRVA